MAEELQFSQAKARLSSVMDDVVHRDRLKAVRRDRGTDEVMYLMAREGLRVAVSSARMVVDYVPVPNSAGPNHTGETLSRCVGGSLRGRAG